MKESMSGPEFAKRVTSLMYGSSGVELNAEEYANLTTAVSLAKDEEAESVQEDRLQVVVDYALFLQEMGGRHRRIGFLVTLLRTLLLDTLHNSDAQVLETALQRIQTLVE